MMRLTTNLPEDVWQRLADEAASKGLSLGKHVQDLIVARDKRQQQKNQQQA